MIKLKHAPKKSFLKDPSLYKSKPRETGEDYHRILWCQEIEGRTNEFLEDPRWFVSEWEELTEEEIPKRYVDGIPFEIDSLVYGASEREDSFRGYALELLPLLDAQGNTIEYPVERLTDLGNGDEVYLLKDSILTTLKERGFIRA